MVALALYALVRSRTSRRRAGRWALGLGLRSRHADQSRPSPSTWRLHCSAVLWRAARGSDRRPAARLGGAPLSPSARCCRCPGTARGLFGLPMQILNRSFKQAAEQQNPEPLTSAALLYYPRTLPTQAGARGGSSCCSGALDASEAQSPRGRCCGSPRLGHSLFHHSSRTNTPAIRCPFLTRGRSRGRRGLRTAAAMARRWTEWRWWHSGALHLMTQFPVPPPLYCAAMIMALAPGRAPSRRRLAARQDPRGPGAGRAVASP
jgi:hypothetical protein